MPNPKYNIIFRACDAVASVHKEPRPFKLDKKTIIKICFVSLYESVKTFPHTITILGDNLSQEILAFFNKFNVTVINKTMGNDESIRQSIKTALSFPNDEWVYFCEDDYLHKQETFSVLNDLIVNQNDIVSTKSKPRWLRPFNNGLVNKPLFIFPTDYPDRYKYDQKMPSFLFLSNHSHWRQICNTTFTFFTKASSIKKFRNKLMKSATGADDAYLSRKLFGRISFWNRGLCIAPIPSLTAHMHESALPPIINWQEILELNSKNPLITNL